MNKLLFIFVLISYLSFGQNYADNRFSVNLRTGVSFNSNLAGLVSSRAQFDFALNRKFLIGASAIYAKGEYNEIEIDDRGFGLSLLYYPFKNETTRNGHFFNLSYHYGKARLTSLEVLGNKHFMLISGGLGRNYIVTNYLTLGYGVEVGYVVGLGEEQRHSVHSYFSIGIQF